MSASISVHAGRTHRKREPRAADLVLRQFVRLLVVALLETILDAAQEPVGIAQLRHGLGRQQLLAREQRQRLEQAARLQPRVATATDQLVGLDDELDLADPARPELDVPLQLAPLDLARDQRLHLAQRLEHPEVEIAPVDERPQHVAMQFVESSGAEHGPRLHVGVALPVAPVLLQVVLEGVEAHDLRPGVPEGPQPQVHAVHESLGRDRAEELRNAPAEPREILLVLERSAAVGLAVLREQEHEVDVRGEVELAAAELAHAQHHQLEFAAVLGAGDTEARTQAALRVIAGCADADLGEQRQFAQHGLDVRVAREVAPGDARELAAPEPPQTVHEGRVIRITGDLGAKVRRQPFA